ncbi:MAG: hypothetical protein OXM55_00580 [Bdellovibrionales bacterium]|nr:hypothetical protein [Bdellovibrionales bacterium]
MNNVNSNSFIEVIGRKMAMTDHISEAFKKEAVMRVMGQNSSS